MSDFEHFKGPAKKAVSDAPMTPSELLDYILGDESDYEDCTEALTDYTAAIRQQAQAEATNILLEKVYSYIPTENLERAVKELGQFSSSYRERIVAQAFSRGAIDMKRRIVAALPHAAQSGVIGISYLHELVSGVPADQADLARLAAADAEKEGK